MVLLQDLNQNDTPGVSHPATLAAGRHGDSGVTTRRKKAEENGHSNGTKNSTNGNTKNGGSSNGTKYITSNGAKHHDAVSEARHHSAISHHAQEDQDGNVLARFLNRVFIPLFLMTVCPNVVILTWYTAVHCDGSFMELFARLTSQGIIAGVSNIWSDVHIGSTLAACTLIGYIVWALLLMILMPGPKVQGPVTPKGNVPVYKDNGFTCFLVSVGALALLTVVLKSVWGVSPTIVYDHFDEFLGTLTVFSHVLCIILHLKGLTKPSTTDCGTSGNLIFDYYWGTELYPRIFGIDIKVFTNCRFGMTVWGLLVLIFALKSYELYGFVDSMWVSAVLQLMYIVKFFWWESGYMNTIDIMLDRAGFYICWGCLSWIPGWYASVSMYLVNQPVYLGPTLSIAILTLGTASIVINYLADKQKQDVRRSKGQCEVWGEKPHIVRAKYTLESGEERESLLLASGWWGVSRHFHYVPELFLTLFWSLPALFSNILPYCYFLYLCILLVHRSFRDESKCRIKYGAYWQKYCALVPYRMIPGLY